MNYDDFKLQAPPLKKGRSPFENEKCSICYEESEEVICHDCLKDIEEDEPVFTEPQANLFVVVVVLIVFAILYSI